MRLTIDTKNELVAKLLKQSKYYAALNDTTIVDAAAKRYYDALPLNIRHGFKFHPEFFKSGRMSVYAENGWTVVANSSFPVPYEKECKIYEPDVIKHYQDLATKQAQFKTKLRLVMDHIKSEAQLKRELPEAYALLEREPKPVVHELRNELCE